MKGFKPLILSILTISYIQISTPQKVVAHPHDEDEEKVEVNNRYNRDRRAYKTSEDIEAIDYWTNYFFKLVYPEMRGKHIRLHHTRYRRERMAIRQVVEKVILSSCQQPDLNRYYFLTTEEPELEVNNRPTRLPKRYPYSNRIKRDRWQPYPRREIAQLRPRYPYHDERLWDEELWGENYYWWREQEHFFASLYRDLTDAIFYARHPELSRNTSRKSHLSWSTEWTFIRKYFASYEQEKTIKQYFIPLCDRYSNVFRN